MIALFNFNDYLGGGETLYVRFAEYLQKNGKDFLLFYRKDSYIAKDLRRVEIANSHLCPIEQPIDYYYLNKQERHDLLMCIQQQLAKCINIQLVSFCLRDLYTLCEVAKQNSNCTVTHLVLHDWDNLYVCQTLTNKLVERLFHTSKSFSDKKMLAFNASLLNMLCESKAIIAQCDLQVKLWNRAFNIKLSYDRVVPLPVYDFTKDQTPTIKEVNNHKIIWIGRIVDFKIPSLCAMINYVNAHKEYSLTVIGYGEMTAIDKYIKENGIDTCNIHFIGKVDYNKLGDIIKEHSIGYAMGTSPIEIGKYGLPIILAMAAPKFKIFKKNFCGGIMNKGSRGNVGNNLYAGEDENSLPTIEDAISEIEENYSYAAKSCYEYLKDSFDINTNLEKYISIKESAEPIDFSDLSIPYCSFIRRFVFKRIK